MVVTMSLELLTSTVSTTYKTCGDCQIRASRARHRILWVGVVGWKILSRYADSESESPSRTALRPYPNLRCTSHRRKVLRMDTVSVWKRIIGGQAPGRRD